jgi:hypothetical protein
MANVQHNALTGTDLHEPKGVAAASEFMIYKADGAGSGAWVLHPTGWGHYADSKVYPTTSQSITSTAAKLECDGAGATSTSVYLPPEIRGSGELWDTTNDKITPVAVGDSYNVRVQMNIAAKTGSPTELTFQLDIGGTGSPSTVIMERYISLSKTPPYLVSVSFPIFCLSTFVTNGGTIFVATDSNSIDVDQVQLFIDRNHAGDAW